MPIKFISLNKKFNDLVKQKGYQSETDRIENYIPDVNKRTYYVSPANSLCFMDGGIDLALSRKVFPGIESKLKMKVKNLNKINLLGRPYLPIGSSVILDENNKSLIAAPTMLLPQNVSSTQNAYYATMAVLYNILVNRNEKLNNVDIIFTSMCCGYGKMSEEESVRQILQGFDDYHLYNANRINNDIIVKEPNLTEQPKYYQNTEWFKIDIKDIIVV